MAGVGINVPINTGGIASAKSQIAALNKDTRAARKEMQALLKEGKDAEAQQQRIAQNEKKIASVKSQDAVAGAKSRIAEGMSANTPGVAGAFHAPRPPAWAGKMWNRAGIPAESLAASAGLGPTYAALTRTAGAYAGPVAVAYAAAKAGEEILATNAPYSNAWEERKSEHRLNQVRMGGEELSLENRRFTSEKMNKESWGNSWIGMFATLGVSNLHNALEQRRLDVDAYSRASSEVRLALRNAGVGGDADSVLAAGKTAAYAEEFKSRAGGFIAEHTIGKLKEIFGSNADAEAAVNETQAALKKFEQNRDAGYYAVTNMKPEQGALGGLQGISLGQPQAFFHEAALALSKLTGKFVDEKAWNSMAIFAENQTAMNATRNWAITQNPLPPLRRGQ